MTGCFGSHLDENYEELISSFRSKYQSLFEYTKMMFPSVKILVTWKIHALVVHLPQFLRRYQTGMAIFAEQTTEAVHADYKKTEKRFLIQEGHVDHSKRLKRMVIEYNSRRI